MIFIYSGRHLSGKASQLPGRIFLKDLDCFYCPEPIPLYPLLMDKTKTQGKGTCTPQVHTHAGCHHFSGAQGKLKEGIYLFFLSGLT